MGPDKVEKLCLRAQEAFALRDWEKAKQAYLMALGLRSDLPDVHYGLATVYFQLRELTSAAHHFREVTRLDPLRAGAHVNLGAVLNLLGQHEESITALRRGIQLDPQRVEGYYNLGLVYRRRGQVDLAIAAYREAIRLNPRMADAYLNLANLYLDKEQFRQSLQHYEDALKVRPGWDKALEGLSQVKAIMSGDSPKAAEPTAAAPANTALERPIDPVIHATFLTNLHHATVTTDETGRLVQKILADEIEPAIKDLSAVLLKHSSRSELEECVTKFEAVLTRMRSAHQALGNCVGRVREFAGRLPEEAAGQKEHST
jgi:tetratricopeptide (TPR) repeat protein